MIIKTKGTTTLEQLNRIVGELVGKVTQQLGATIEGVKIKDAELGVVLTINGEEQYVTVNHDGLDEVFKVVVALDENGEVKKERTNEKESFLDGYTRSQATGQQQPAMTRIESVYNDEDLTLAYEEVAGDLTERGYRHKDNLAVIRYYREGIGLVGEMAYEENQQ